MNTSRWGIGAVLVLAMLLAGGALVNRRVNERLQRVYEIPDPQLVIPNEPASLERGEHLVSNVFLCQECHGEQLEGRLYFDHPLLGHIAAPNLTRGEGGAARRLSDPDWVRAIHHGVGPDGKPLLGMPSNFYARIGDRDLADIIAYLKSLPPVDNTFPPKTVGLFTRISILGDPTLLPAEVIDHAAPIPAAPLPSVSVDYGHYLSIACTVCHGENFAGGTGAGAGLNLTSGGDLADWGEADFLRTVRTGVTPKDRELNPNLMPWKRIRGMSDDELRAIWLYLQSLTAIPNDQ